MRHPAKNRHLAGQHGRPLQVLRRSHGRVRGRHGGPAGVALGGEVWGLGGFVVVGDRGGGGAAADAEDEAPVRIHRNRSGSL